MQRRNAEVATLLCTLQNLDHQPAKTHHWMSNMTCTWSKEKHKRVRQNWSLSNISYGLIPLSLPKCGCYSQVLFIPFTIGNFSIQVEILTLC